MQPHTRISQQIQEYPTTYKKIPPHTRKYHHIEEYPQSVIIQDAGCHSATGCEEVIITPRTGARKRFTVCSFLKLTSQIFRNNGLRNL